MADGLADTGAVLSPPDGERIIRLVAHHVGAEVHAEAPRVSAELPGTGERFEGLLPPIVSAPTFAIRKPAVAVFTLQDSVASGILSADAANHLRGGVTSRANILVAGGTSTGKTTLPGELGRAILGAQDRGQPVPAPPLSGPLAPTVDPEEQRRLQELDAARLSALFAEAQTVPRGGAQATPTPPTTGALFPSTLGSPTASDPVSNREAFLTRPGNTDTVSAQRVTPPPSPYILQAGTVIPAALITGLRSDLPGQISARVTSNVYDSPSGRYLLIPQGARLLGEYDSRIASGQSRLLLVWTRLILPDGRSIVLERAPGTDGTGASGLQDRVNYHWGRVFLAAGLATILNLGLESGAETEDDVARAIREAAQNTIGRTGDEIVRQQLAVPPTLTIRPGFPVRVMVTRDLILEPLGEVR